MACRCCTNSLSECLKDLKDSKLWRGVLAEGIGTMILVFIGCGACLNNEWETFSPTQVQISLTFGLAVATIVWMIAHISGGHINPAVTVALLVTRKITLVRALLFIAVQCAGAIAGAALLMGVTPKDGRASLGLTSINEHMEVEQAFAVETIITFVLVFTVFSSIDSNRKDLGGSAPLAVGLSVTLCHLFAVSTYLPTYLLTLLLTYSLTYLLTYVHTYLLTYLHTYLLTYSLIYFRISFPVIIK